MLLFLPLPETFPGQHHFQYDVSLLREGSPHEGSSSLSDHTEEERTSRNNALAPGSLVGLTVRSCSRQFARKCSAMSRHRTVIVTSTEGWCPSSIDVRVVQGYPHWACSCSLFGGSGNLARKGEASDHCGYRSPLAFARFSNRHGLLADGKAHTKRCSLGRGARKGAGATQTSRTLLD